MQSCKQYRVCRAQPASSTTPVNQTVARITPCRYSTRQAVGRYWRIQNDDGSEQSSCLVRTRG